MWKRNSDLMADNIFGKIKTISQLVNELNHLKEIHGDLPVKIDALDFDDAREIHSVNFSMYTDNEEFICINNYD